MIPPGVALFDYDQDGDLDVFALTGGALVPPKPPGEGGKPRSGAGGRLFRNDLANGVLRFTDVTAASRLDVRGHAMGVAVGDVNNDGCPDLYVTALGDNQLLRNHCDGTFSDVTRAAGVADPGWSVSAAFFDYDRDGWLDLFVGHYLDYRVESHVECRSQSGQLDYCAPHAHQAQPSHLFRNQGDGTFRDVTAAAGLAREFGPALGASTADFDGDGWLDLYVANDGAPNQLWINGRDGTFRDTALLGGAAVSPDGVAKGSMGVDAGDVDNDGDEDLFITELTGQGVDLYVNDGSGSFTDRSATSGLRLATLPVTGFGAAWFDLDNDGWLDVAAVNGAVTHTAEALARGERFALAQRRQLFRNLGDGRFEDVSGRAGAAYLQEEVGRGAAFGDLDNDGDTDLLVANAGGPLRLFLNAAGSRHAWIGLRLLTAAGRDALGARVTVTTPDGRRLSRRARADGSYASANDPRVLVGLGIGSGPVRVEVAWPDGASGVWDDVPAGRYTTLRQPAPDSR